MIGIRKLFEFQEACSSYIVNYCNSVNKKTLIVKAPTGSGKTIILLDFIDKYVKQKTRKVCFIWLTPGSGELEEQSKQKLDKHLPQFTSKTVDDVLNGDFDDRDVCFINWERVTKKGNRAIMETERKNIYERIADAHRNHIDFILIIDEEHQNNTSKARDIIDAFAPIYTIRVSATANENKAFDMYEIDEVDVIASGLITKALYINEGISNAQIQDENALLLNLASEKRKAIKREYEKLGKKINPLVIVQFPNENLDLIKSIEEKLSTMDITYDNGRLAIWMSGNEYHKNIENITEMNNSVQFLLIKQAISTGWDCPRAKVLVKLRENMSEQFEIQTLGRLRRMPEARHYDNELLDNAYLYTFDEKYRESVMQNIDRAYFVRRIFLKPEFYEFSLVKELRNLDYNSSGEREKRDRLAKFYKEKYKLTNDVDENKVRLIAGGYNLSDRIEKTIIQDKVVRTIDMIREDAARYGVSFAVNTHEHAIDLRQSIDSFKSLIGLSYEKTRVLLELLFRNNRRFKNKFLKLSTPEFYAFILNNVHKIREDLREGMIGAYSKQSILIESKEEIFRFPHEEVFKYIEQKDTELITKNVYRDYTDDCLVEEIRSKSERLFERFCESSETVSWYYKNGDTGQQYFSITYLDGNQEQHLFYADYIVGLKNGDIWIIETKGGEGRNGINKNIDIQVRNKFDAFKQYAEKHNINWGFVRDKNEKLYINNTKYADDMCDEGWITLNF